jgi:hypothetical protein
VSQSHLFLPLLLFTITWPLFSLINNYVNLSTEVYSLAVYHRHQCWHNHHSWKEWFSIECDNNNRAGVTFSHKLYHIASKCCFHTFKTCINTDSLETLLFWCTCHIICRHLLTQYHTDIMLHTSVNYKPIWFPSRNEFFWWLSVLI